MAVYSGKGPMNNQGIGNMTIEQFQDWTDGQDWGLPGLNLGGGTGTGTKASDILNKLKFQYQVRKDNAASNKAAENLAAQNAALTSLYTSGQYGDSARNYTSALDTMRGTSEQGINDQLARSLASLNEGYAQAQGLTDTGYQNLVKALSGYQNPYASMQSPQPVPVGNSLEGLLTANNADISDFQKMLNTELQAGQSNQQDLLSALAQIASSGQQSRSAEAELANQFAQANLGANRANYQGQLQTSANQALVDLANQIAQKKAEAQAQAEQQKFALAQLLAQAGIDVTKLNPTTPPPAEEILEIPDFSNITIDPSQIDFSGLNNMFGPGFGSGR